jgi:hypothetical protein
MHPLQALINFHIPPLRMMAFGVIVHVEIEKA